MRFVIIFASVSTDVVVSSSTGKIDVYYYCRIDDVSRMMSVDRS